MCEYRVPSRSKNCCVSPEVDTAALRSSSRSPAAATVHPRNPGGASPQTISPLAATSTRRIPIPRNTRNTSSAANPFPTAPKSNRIPARPSQARPPTTCNSRQLTNARAAAVNGARARHNRVNGPTVTSKAPPEASLSSLENRKTEYNSELTTRGVWSNEFNSLPAA